MLWAIEKEKRDFFNHKVFKEYLSQRRNINFKEIEDLIHIS